MASQLYLETAEAGFVAMDRLQTVEQDTVVLKAENTALQSQVDELHRELDRCIHDRCHRPQAVR